MNYLFYSICKNAPQSLCLFTMEIFHVCVKTHYLVVLDQFFYKQTDFIETKIPIYTGIHLLTVTFTKKLG